MRLSRDERLLMIGCWTKLADDEGRFLADPAYIKKEVFGYDDLSVSEVSRILQKITETFRTWLLYRSGDHQYVQIETSHWLKYQEIRYIVRSKLPKPTEECYVLQKKGTSEDFRNIQKISENLCSRDARAVGLGSVGFSSENQCASDDVPLVDFALSELVVNGKASNGTHSAPGRKWQTEFFHDKFWPLRWRTNDKKGARIFFEHKVKTIEQANAIVTALISQKPQFEKRDLTLRPYMITWLNKGSYEDDPETDPIVSQPPKNIRSLI